MRRRARFGCLWLCVPCVLAGTLTWLRTGCVAASELDALVLASGQGDLTAVQQVLRTAPGAARGAEPLRRVTALHNAAAIGSVPILRALLDAGADVNAPDFNGATALIYAVAAAKLDAVRFLLPRDAATAINLRPSRTPTALVLAVQSRREDVVQAILDAGADPRLPDAFGTTPAQAAARMGDVRMQQQIAGATRYGREGAVSGASK